MAAPHVERFDAVIMPHLDAAYTLACYLLRDEHDAQDVVQDAALRAFRYFDSYRDGDARAWFLAIVRNCCLTWQRRRRNDRLTVPLAPEHASAAQDSRETDARAIEASDRAAINRAVAELPAEFREVIILREVQDMSYAQISTVVGVPIGTVMSRLSRARKRLAAILGTPQEAD
ncbi:MAG TPA: sigma-70 family RNA polymerase sigma factor [Gemmatimonadaceae bacterium]|jgi:RNA polymerase sigma-70 factor (ECF subfamily)|nr:sigma-70 family RNA polymerase sigma factor [Gemmatimonadaceae bacterium]